jgi:Leucine-rich repeat (LRR) protein
MGLTELPSEVFRFQNVGILSLDYNNLCSLPSAIGHLETLNTLCVRLTKRFRSAI